ncbi:MAG TPA: helix-turn-helix domain-containing protein [Pyrinomonadaceae bacterium]|nr:helix-turn-helix domain-containing protein [Pyrinomonadaceae bacterium]
MDSGISLIKSLATTLLSEIDSLAVDIKEPGEDSSFVLSNSVRDFEIKLIKTALLKTGGNQRRAASILGVKVTTLHNKIKTYGIDCLKIPM